jgi:hypothetical protein
MKCSICESEIEVQLNNDGEVLSGGGNNAEPVNEGRCCNDCNMKVVVPARMSLMFNQNKES